MTVSDIRKQLIEEYGYSEEDANNIKGKSALLKELEDCTMNLEMDDNPTEDESFLELSEIVSEEDILEEELDFGSQEWNDYVLSLCNTNELVDGYPNVYALRRLVKKLIGEIASSQVVQVVPHMWGNAPSATVQYQIEVINHKGSQVFTDVADCWYENSDAVYAVHPSATASTRAEGRCLRKILGLTVNTAEEMDNPNDPKDAIEKQVGRSEEIDYTKESVTSTQKILITSKCESMQISVNKFLKQEFDDKYASIEQLNREDAASLIKKINAYQNNEKIPGEIKL